MDFVKANWSAQRPGGIRPARWLFWLWMDRCFWLRMGTCASWTTLSAKEAARCTYDHRSENELLKSDQQLRDAIRAYDAAQN